MTITTCGMTSPARWTSTVSPSRMSLRSISSWLCRLARLTVTPPMCTGSSMGMGGGGAGGATAAPPQLDLQRPVVDLDDDPVNLVGEAVAPGEQFGVVGEQGLDVLA